MPNRWHGKVDVFPLTFKEKFDGKVACGIVADEGDYKSEGDITYVPILAKTGIHFENSHHIGGT